MKKQKVISLARVSTKSQAEEGLSLENQHSKIDAYCSLYGYEVVKRIDDIGSGNNAKREGLTEALRMLRDGEATAISVYRIDRIARSLFLFQTLLEEYFKKGKYTLLSVEDKIDTSCPNSMLITNIIQTVAEWELGRIKQRVKESMQFLQDNNKSTGTATYGKKVDALNNLISNAEELKIIAKIKRYRKKKLSFRKIADKLFEQGVRSRKGNKLDHTRLCRIYNANI